METEAREEILMVTKMFGKGMETSEEERVSVKLFQTNPATVSVKAGATLNMGNYESARVDVMLTVPCYTEEINDAYAYAKTYVDARLSEEYAELKESAK